MVTDLYGGGIGCITMPIALLAFFLLIVGRTTPPVYCASIEDVPSELDLVLDFTHYSLYFQEQKASLEQCSLRDFQNSTYLAFSKSVDRCPDRHYSPRFLTASQISWKTTPWKADDIWNAEWWKAGSARSLEDAGVENVPDEKKDNEIIHKYLAFALLLPKHPFSTDLLRSLINAGPMFPSVTVVSGNGYDFKEMCKQYNIRSFPQLIFFKDGLLFARYDGGHNTPEVASKLAQWTKSLPKALPTLRTGLAKYSSEKTFFPPPETELFSFDLFGRHISAKVPYITEPIMGSMEYLMPYDTEVFILSGIFCVARLAYFLLVRKSVVTVST